MQTPVFNVSIGAFLAGDLADQFSDAEGLSSSGVTFPNGTLLRDIDPRGSTEIVVSAWAHNPFMWHPNGPTGSNVLSISITSRDGNHSLTFLHSWLPIVVSVQASITSDVSLHGCVFWDADAMLWGGDGMALIALQPSATNPAVVTVVCASLRVAAVSSAVSPITSVITPRYARREVGVVGASASGQIAPVASFPLAVTALCIFCIGLGWWIVVAAQSSREKPPIAVKTDTAFDFPSTRLRRPLRQVSRVTCDLRVLLTALICCFYVSCSQGIDAATSVPWQPLSSPPGGAISALNTLL